MYYMYWYTYLIKPTYYKNNMDDRGKFFLNLFHKKLPILFFVHFHFINMVW